MKQIIRGRRAGKTTDAIKLSAETGNYILVANRSQVQMVAKMASDLNLNIPYPVSVSEIVDGRADGSSLKRHGVIIDEALQVLQELLRVPINAVVISANKDVEIIEYNRKVKIPEFVAEFIEQKKKVTIYLGQIFRRAYNWGNKDEKVDNWLAHGNNHETFARAWLDGYEIEEEPKYWVKCNDSYLSFVTFSHKSASEIETSPDYLEAILFTFKPQADHMALLVNGTVEEVNNG